MNHDPSKRMTMSNRRTALPHDTTVQSSALERRSPNPAPQTDGPSNPGDRSLTRLAFLGSHPPRQCGIATFTADLSRAIAAAKPELSCSIVAMDDVGKRYLYPPEVAYQVPEESLTAYRRAADFLNVSNIDLLSLQHEYGIFGGKAGAHVLTLLHALRMPIVTTFHTILAAPSRAQRTVMGELCALSARLVVMSRTGAELLRDVHGISPDKIEMIPHGVPQLPDAAESKMKLGLGDRRIVLTFGLLSADKGIEHVIDALPTIVRTYPDVLYIVLGATHPQVKELHGEVYRLMLEARGHALGVEDHLLFHDRFVTRTELGQFLAAADIYVTPYLNPEQITSGTLAYAVGGGKAVVSSPYRYSRELLADGRGVLVPAGDSVALAEAVLGVFGNDSHKRQMERRAAGLGATMRWPVVAEAYLRCFDRALASRSDRSDRHPASTFGANTHSLLPEVNLGHLRTLTDDTGMLQHAIFSVPRYEDGYCLDDNARALLLLAWVEEARIEPPTGVRALATRYLAFVRHAFDADTGRFRNFMSYARQWTESIGSEDSHGRAMWALGVVIARTRDPGRRSLAIDLFRRALPAVEEFTSSRAWAYTLLGISECISTRGLDHTSKPVGRLLAERLLRQFLGFKRQDWLWCEERLTYCNARLPQALLASGLWTENTEMIETGLASLDWLYATETTAAGLFSPTGSNGFFPMGGRKAAYDQQPVEACAMISACFLAHRITSDSRWTDRARQAFEWFLGQNQRREWLYDASTGGCRDGLHPDRPNENQGAESTLSFLMALLDMHQSVRIAAPPSTDLKANQ